jgi:urease accessory protein
MKGIGMGNANGPLRVGIGGPVGAGKTTLTEKLCRALWPRYSVAVITNDIYTREDAEFLMRAQACPPERIRGVETGGCPHTAIREDASINLAAVAELPGAFPDLDVVLIESGGDNLAATFSPGTGGSDALCDRHRRGAGHSAQEGARGHALGPSDRQQDRPRGPCGRRPRLLEADARAARGERPFVMASLRDGVGVDDVVRFIEEAGGL